MRLRQEKKLDRNEMIQLLETANREDREFLAAQAREVREKIYGKDVFVRGLIEFTNICRNDCYYCGIRKSNEKVERYRLTPEEILSCAKEGYELGFRTFVLQGGEDGWFTKERVASIVRELKKQFPDCAVTLSIGERTKEEYECFREAGADRYLLRHETADDAHYRKLHPQEMKLKNRKECLFTLRELGYEVGAGFMVGSPGQTVECLAEDFEFLQELKPHMIGIGPYITHGETPFAQYPSGSLEKTLRMVSILRLLFPYALIPSTTALGTIHPEGRELGLKAGGNVVMPNLSPVSVRKKYDLYENKICTGEEAAQCRGCLEQRVARAGYRIVTDRGDVRR